MNDSIRVEEQDVTPGSQEKSLVVCCGKPTIFGVTDQARVWKHVRNHSGRTVARAIVNDKDFSLKICQP
jgi:hypothetical protein